MSGYFDGLYFKHQNGEHTLALIPGISDSGAFVQVITGNSSYQFEFPAGAYRRGDTLTIAGNEFSREGIKIDLRGDGVSFSGEIKYRELTPLKYDIMGPFKFLPMQCRHTVVSLHHWLEGGIQTSAGEINFTGGKGYIEGDSGISFPKSYAWFQCNDFEDESCVMISVADIPFLGGHFRGCTGVVATGGQQHRIATFLGAKILRCDKQRILIKQGGYLLDVRPGKSGGYSLSAPEDGKMSRTITEYADCGGAVRLIKNGRIIFNRVCRHAGYEYIS